MIFKNSSFNRCFGIEFEVEPTVSKTKLGEIIGSYDSDHPIIVEKPTEDGGWAESKNNNYWHVKYDSTCGPFGKGIDFGWEIATFVGNNLSHLDLFAGLATQLKKNNVSTNNNCGLHIHVNVLGSTTEEVGTMLANWLKIEPILYHTFPTHRKYNIYCGALRNKVNVLKLETNISGEDVYNALAPENLNIHDNYDKRVSLNLVGYERSISEGDNKRATLEFRLPECILDSKHVKNCALFIINFINNSKKLPQNLNIVNDIDEFFELCGLGGRDVILDNNLLDLKIWFLKRLIKNSTLKKWQKNAEKKLNYITKLHN